MDVVEEARRMSALDAEALNKLWKGKYICTEDSTVAPSGHPEDPPIEGRPFGGEGVVLVFYEQDGEVWVEMDWGFAWIIKPTTVITEVRLR